MKDLQMPALGMAMTEAAILQWLHAPGDLVTVGEPLAEIETEKSTVVIESPAAGRLGPLLFAAGDIARVGACLVVIFEEGDEPAEPPRPARVPGPGQPGAGGAEAAEHPVPGTAALGSVAPGSAALGSVAPGSAAPVSVAPVSAAPGSAAPAGARDSVGDVPPPRHRLSPRQRRLLREQQAGAERAGAQHAAAEQAGAQPTGTEQAGAQWAAAERAGAEQAGAQWAGAERAGAQPAGAQPAAVERAGGPAAAAGPAAAGRFRAAIAAQVTYSWQTIPHFSVTRELAAGPLLESRRLGRGEIPDLGITDLLCRALGRALGGTPPVSLGLAVDTPAGVVVPVLPDVVGTSLADLVAQRRAAVARAMSGRAAEQDVSPAPRATLSNMGGYGVDQFTGIIPAGQDLLLTVGRIAPRVVAVDGAAAVRPAFTVTLVADHRRYDGADLARLIESLACALAAEPAGAGSEQS